MRAVRASVASGRTATAEVDVTVSTVKVRTPLVFCHGSGLLALTAYEKPGHGALLRALGQDYTLTAPDLGGETWGNDTAITRVGQAKTYLNSLGATGPVVMVTNSMGALAAMNYALANPANVIAIAAITPAVDLVDLHDNRGAAAGIDAAYGTYNNATHGPTHNPVVYAASLTTPIALFTSTNDTVTVPSTADVFMAARPATTRYNLGAVGHGDTAFPTAMPLVLEWLSNVT